MLDCWWCCLRMWFEMVFCIFLFICFNVWYNWKFGFLLMFCCDLCEKIDRWVFDIWVELICLNDLFIVLVNDGFVRDCCVFYWFLVCFVGGWFLFIVYCCCFCVVWLCSLVDCWLCWSICGFFGEFYWWSVCILVLFVFVYVRCCIWYCLCCCCVCWYSVWFIGFVCGYN